SSSNSPNRSFTRTPMEIQGIDQRAPKTSPGRALHIAGITGRVHAAEGDDDDEQTTPAVAAANHPRDTRHPDPVAHQWCASRGSRPTGSGPIEADDRTLRRWSVDQPRAPARG